MLDTAPRSDIPAVNSGGAASLAVAALSRPTVSPQPVSDYHDQAGKDEYDARGRRTKTRPCHRYGYESRIQARETVGVNALDLNGKCVRAGEGSVRRV